MDEKTTIKVSKDLVLKLNKIKIHPRQSNEEVILKLIEGYNGKK
jgi:predicted CopG family antitoxin